MPDTEDGTTATIEEQLEAAAESSTTGKRTTGTEEKTEENRIPQSRFNEVNTALKEERAAAATARSQLAEAQSMQLRLQELLTAKEADVQTLNEIKSYVNDPTMADHVLAIDRRLKGIEEEVESGETTPEEAMDKTRALLEATKEEVLDARADVQAEALITKADIIADKLLGSLPEEYTEQDRGVISDLWTEKMDWDAAVADPDNLSGILTETFQATLDRYGTPRGALYSQEEIDEISTDVAVVKTPEEELNELMAKPWGALKEVTTKSGKVQKEPELSNDQFNVALATAMRQIHKR